MRRRAAGAEHGVSSPRVAMCRGVLLVLAALAVVTVSASPALASLPVTATPALSLVRTIRTTPFVNTSLSMRDGEGSAFVANDPAHPNRGGTDSLWLLADNGRTAWEINPNTGALKSRITDADWQATKQYDPIARTGTGPTAGTNRDPDLESLAYDRVTDTLYAFNGKCCTSTVLPTAYRLTRGTDGGFRPESWQPLPAGSNYTASGWNPADRKVYVGVGSDLRSYDYVSNAPGAIFRVTNLSGILGLSFSDDGADLFVVTSAERLHRVTWSTKTLKSGWSFDLTPFGVKDSRAVELVSDQFYVLDGYDGRSTGDPLKYAVFVFDVCCGTATAPTASFTSAPVVDQPLTVQFTDTSTGGPTGWSWDFGDGSTSASQNPVHTFAAAGDYTVTLVASNATGPSAPFARSVSVGTTPAPTTFAPSADSYVSFGSPNKNYGTYAVLKGKLTSTGEYRTYLTFSVTGLQGQTVSAAKLRLYVTDGSPTGGDWFTTSSAWTETGTGSITWNNAPAISGTKVATAGPATAGSWLDVDLSTAVTGEGTYSFVMTTQISNTVMFSSKEGTQPPRLQVTLQ